MKLNLTIKKFYLFISMITVVLLFNLQIGKSEPDSTKNREFILTFLPNFHSAYRSQNASLRLGDSISIFIYSSEPTKGTIEFTDKKNIKNKINFSIPNPSVVYVFKRTTIESSLLGYNVSGVLFDWSTNSESISNLSFKITTDKPVHVYGHSQAILSGDSFNVLPFESLGNEYFVLAYNEYTDVFNTQIM